MLEVGKLYGSVLLSSAPDSSVGVNGGFGHGVVDELLHGAVTRREFHDEAHPPPDRTYSAVV